MATIATLVVRLQADVADLRTSLEKSNEMLSGVEKQTKKTQDALGKLGNAFAGAFTIMAISNAGREFVAFTRTINDLSLKTGIGTDALQKLGYAAKMNGVDVDQLAQGVVKLGKNLITGPDSAVKAADALGLSLGALKKMAPEDAFIAVGDAIAKIPNPMERSAIAVALFGKAGSDYLPIFNGDLSETMQRAERLGLVLSEDVVKAGDKFGDMLDTLGLAKMVVFGKAFVWINSIVDQTVIHLYNFLSRVADAMAYTVDMAARVAGALGRGEDEAILRNYSKAIREQGQWYEDASVSAFLMAKSADEASAAAGRQAKRIGEVSGAFDAASKAGKTLADLQDKLSGKDIIARADLYVDALKNIGGAEGYAGGLAKLTGEALDDVRKVMEAGAYAARAWGDKTKAAIFSVANEFTYLKSTSLAGYGTTPVATSGMPTPTLPSTPISALGYAMAPSTANLGVVIDRTKDWGATIESVGNIFAKTFQNINSQFGQMAQLVGNGFKVLGTDTEEFGSKASAAGNKAAAAFGMLGGVLSELAGGAPSKAMQMAIGAAGGAMAGAAVGSMIGTNVAPATMGISIAVGALAGAIVGWATATMKAKQAALEATKQTRIYEDELLATYGSLSNIAMLSNVVGVNLAGAFGRTGPFALEQMNIAMKAFKAKMEELQGDLDKYGLTWLDLNDDMKKFTVGNTSADLLSSFELMTNAGADSSKVIKGMGGDLSALVVNAIKSGQKIPSALQPILKSLIEMGGLTDEAARAMLNLPADTMPALKDIDEAAKRYGLTLDDLGPKVKQLQITDSAKQIVADFDLLTLAGADVNTVMRSMKEPVQDLVTKALKFGLDLPASMKPLAEQMIAAGLLVDANGEKLTDLGKLTFALDLTKAFDALILKLDELIDKLVGKSGVSEAFGSAFVDPSAFDVPGTGRVDDPARGGVPEFALGGVVPQYLSTGGHLLAFRPRGTDTIPAMLTPGEGVLSRRGMQALGELNSGRSGGTGGDVNITVISQLDGREVARNQVRYAPGALKAAGL